MTMRIVAPLFLAIISSVFVPQADAFQTINRPMSSVATTSRASRSSLTSLNVVGPEHVQWLLQDGSQHVLQSPAFLLLSDAVEALAVKEDIGWWDSYLQIFKGTLQGVHDVIDPPLRSAGVTQTWGVSIFLFTAGVRSLLLPLSLQQSKSAEYVKALKPYMSEIKEKMKDNKDAQNRAIAKLYEDANQNPLAGCITSLVQLPIFLGLYRGVKLLAQDGKLEEPFLWIPSLEGPVSAPNYSGMDWLTQGWAQVDGSWVPSMGWETTLAFLVMPVLLVLGQSFTMSTLTPPPDESTPDEEREQLEKTQGFLKFLPLMIGFFSLQVPAGLTIYWFTSNAFTLSQSLIVRKYYEANPPKIELPEYWDALEDMEKMSAEDKRKAAEAGIVVGPKWEELLQEAQFHTVVDRKPLRLENEAWQRVMVASSESDTSMDIPSEFQAWVNAPTNTAALKTEEPTLAPADATA